MAETAFSLSDSHRMALQPAAPPPPEDVLQKLRPLFKGRKVALVHEWLYSQRGGGNVFAAICELFKQLSPAEAKVFVLLYEPGSVSSSIEALGPVATSFLQNVPKVKNHYRHFLPLMPLAIGAMDLSDFDVVISSSHCVAKGVRKNKGAIHLSYIHAPMRYMWERFHEYFNPERSSLVTRIGANLFRPLLQAWDRRSSKDVDWFFANSKFIASRVAELYGRDATVIYPFCDVSFFTEKAKALRSKDEHWTDAYLIVSALVPYKRVDQAIEACAQLKRKLRIIGDGPDLARLKRLAQSLNAHVEFVGTAARDELVKAYISSKALLFPGIEDFGIVPLEAMACGLPVIAFGKGGALETVVEGSTGVFFHEESVSGLVDAIQRYEGKLFENLNQQEGSEACRQRASEFDADTFYRKLANAISTKLKALD